MQGEKKTKSLGSQGEREHLGRGLLGRIEEYNFFLAPNEEALEEGVPERKAQKKKQRNDPNKSMSFFLSEDKNDV